MTDVRHPFIDGKPVKSIWWNGANGDKTLTADKERSMVYRSEYHGDHQCEYVAVIVDGKEVARHNVRYIATIHWASDDD